MPRKPPEALLEMGRIAGSYGVRGWVKVVPGGGATEGLAEAQAWWIGGEAYEVAEARVHGATVVAKLQGLETREQALGLKGAAVSVERETLPEPEAGHYYLADLVGLDVVNEQGEALGTVKKFFTNGAQDVMEVVGDKERLMPWVPSIVKEVDLQKRQITVEWEADW